MAVQWDRHTGYALLLTLCMGFFTALWGLRLPTLTAGMALYVMLISLYKKAGQKRRDKQRHLAKRRILGDLALERLLLLPETKAQQQAARWLMGKDITILSAAHDHTIISANGKPVLLHYAPLHAQDTLEGSHVARIQRLMLHDRTADGVLLCPGKISMQAWAQCKKVPRVRILTGDELRCRLGAHAVFSDAEVKKHARLLHFGASGSLFSRALWTDKNALQLAKYALLMNGLLLFTNRRAYGFSALCLMAVSALVHTLANKKRPLKGGR